jgi:hypothetical protein
MISDIFGEKPLLFAESRSTNASINSVSRQQVEAKNRTILKFDYVGRQKNPQQ